ncbi:MAG: phenylalanine--tRNA ligase subunit beta [Candidatus Aureabacteria bacterium]|nr:phenylalanine--tRNA ligase subunit beta [Candidatus Auribacterota bacterium]
MKLTFNWLKEHLDFSPTLEETLTNLTMLGLEVEEVNPVNPLFPAVISARIESVENHPGSSQMKICSVSDGHETLPVVCGAMNVRPGMIVPLAKPSSEILGKTIQVASIAGINSYGMLCSEKELQIGFDQTGILELEQDTVIGKTLNEILSLNDTVIDLSITPNRGDCLSVRGIAREVAASFSQKILKKEPPIPAGKKTQIKVEIQEKTQCPVYGGAFLTNVKIGTSPFAMRYRLFLAGIRPINNIADITNFILIDIGQPMHAFDHDKIAGKKIIVRKARKGESILALDGLNYDLHDEDLVIADEHQVLAIAGIMGGELSSVHADTKNVFFESACFDPVTVRRTSRRLNLNSESSYRFERGIDREAIPLSLLLASNMSRNLAGGNIIHPRINLHDKIFKRKKILLRTERCHALLGLKLKEKEIERILTRIDIKKSGKHYLIPSFRSDLEKEIDLIEEIARVHGYDRIPETHEKVEILYTSPSPLIQLTQTIKATLVQAGFLETINYSFMDPKNNFSLEGFIEKPLFPEIILNPLSPSQSVMRHSLLPGLVQSAVNSRHYGTAGIKMFETGCVFPGKKSKSGSTDSPQVSHTGLILTGTHVPSSLGESARKLDFLDLKGAIEMMFNKLRIPVEFEPLENHLFQTGLKATCREIILGMFGELSANFIKQDCKDTLFYGEFSNEKMVSCLPPEIQYSPLNRLPAITEDMSFLADQNITHQEIVSTIRKCGITLLEAVKLFDIYQGKGIPDGKKSMAYSLTYRDKQTTLTMEAAHASHEQIKENLKKELNVEFR